MCLFIINVLVRLACWQDWDEGFALWRMALPRQTPQVVWLRIGHTRRSELLHRIEHLLPQIIDGLERGESLSEVR
ncbi:hypothetical protein CCR96_20400 [Halochromatium roseum]|nr:hypothetical protein [Halochromatium roseum]